MTVAAFEIRRKASGDVEANVPWLQTSPPVTGAITAIADASPGIEFTDPFHEVNVGDFVGVQITQTVGSDPDVNFASAIVTETSATSFTVATAPYPGAVNYTGPYQHAAPEFWNNNTPPGVLREIHIQFDTTGSTGVTVKVTLSESGVEMFINNGDPIIGLATFTMFVERDTVLNFSSEEAANFVIVITGD